MNKSLLFARSNVRKAKGQTAAIIVLVLIASIMMNLWLMLATDYKKNLDRVCDRLNDGHITIFAYRRDEDFRNFVTAMLEDISDITEYCVTDAFGWPGHIDFNGGEINSCFIFIEKMQRFRGT